MKVEHLLSADFIVFSKRVAELYELKEAKTAEFKQAYADYKAGIAEIDVEVQRLKDEFDSKHND